MNAKIIWLLSVAMTFAGADIEKPNVIFFMADDMGMGDTSVYQDFTGNDDDAQIDTPAMERLANMGVRFTDAHTPSSRCTPTRYGLLTGRDPWRTRLKSYVLFGAQGDPLIEKDRPTLATLFRDQGYGTAIVGKWHVGLLYNKADGTPSDSLEDADLRQGVADGPMDHGFEFSRYSSRSHLSSAPNTETRERGGPGYMYGRDAITANGPHSFYMEGPKAFILEELGSRYSDHAVEYLDSHREVGANADKPFFLYYPSHSNHTPYTTTDSIDWVPVAGASKRKSGEPSGERMDFIYENDVALGRLLDWLEANDDPRHPGKKFIDTTVVIFTSDNGAEINEKFATGPFRSNKASCYEGGHRVPFIVAWGAGGIGDGNGETPGGTNATPISLSDMYATFSELLDVPLPDLAAGEKGAEDSVSALSFWRGEESDRSSVPMFCNDNKTPPPFAPNDPSRDPAILMMRLDNPVVDGKVFPGQWKIFYDPTMIRAGKVNPVELYDLVTDQREANNRVTEPGLRPMIEHLNQLALKHRSAGGHRLAELGSGDSIPFDIRGNGGKVITQAGLTLEIDAAGSRSLAYNDEGLGVQGGASAQVDGGEALKLSFDKDVIVESIRLVAGSDGVAGGFYEIGAGASIPVYCVDAHAEKYTAFDHSGMLADVGVLKAGQVLRLDSGSHYGANAPGSWWLESIQVQALKSD